MPATDLATRICSAVRDKDIGLVTPPVGMVQDGAQLFYSCSQEEGKEFFTSSLKTCFSKGRCIALGSSESRREDIPGKGVL